MAKKVYIAEFDANADPYLRKLKGIENKTATMSKNVESSIGKINASYLKMAAGIAAVSTATNYLTGIIKAYGEEEKAIKRVDTALGRVNQTLTDYAGQLQKTTTYSDDQVLSVMALISNYVKSETLIRKLTKATLSFATAKQIDVETAADLIAKTVAGANALKKQGVEFDNTTKGVERVNAVLEALSLFQGQAEAETETYSGKLEQMTNQFANLEDAIAQGIMPTLAEFADQLSKIGNNIDNDGIGSLVDKWLKLAFIVPRATLKGVAWLSDAVLGNDGKDWTGSVGYASNYGKDVVVGNNTTGTSKKGPKQIPMLVGRKQDYPQRYLEATMGYAGTRGGTTAGLNSGFGAMEMTQVAIPQIEDKFEVIGDSFVNKFYGITDVANQFGNLLNISADSFVGKMITGMGQVSQVLSIITSIIGLASSPVTSFMGLAQGGTVVNKNGKLSYAPIPKFARGGSYMVPAGYSNDSGLIRVQSGERVDVTPSNQVPMLGKALNEIKQAIMAGNMNSARKGKQPVVVNVMLDGVNVTKSNLKNQNRMSSAGQDFGDYR